MYIDEKISLRDNLPDELQRDFKELQGYYDANDWFMFDTVFEAVEASVKADTAYYWDKKGLYKLIGHVSILSQEGKKLDTSILYFDQKEDQIYTDEYFELEEGDKIITGIGFKSNQNMTKYKIFNSQGTFPVSDTARDTSRVNTATGDSVAVNIAKPDSIK